jgi:hypothetical protein
LNHPVSNEEGAINMITFKNALNFTSLFSALALAIAIPAALAAPVGPLIPLVAGQPAKASDVNGNFSTIVTTVNANDTRLTTVETNKQNIVTGSCSAGSAIRAIAANGTVTCQNAGGNVGFASVAAVVGVPRFPTTTTSQGNGPAGEVGRYSSSGSDFLVAPMVLPHGATVTTFSLSCLRNNAASCFGYLYRTDGNAVAVVNIAAQAATVQTVTTTSISTSPSGIAVVDNQNFSYWLYMEVNGTAGSAIMPVRGTVTYTLP